MHIFFIWLVLDLEKEIESYIGQASVNKLDSDNCASVL